MPYPSKFSMLLAALGLAVISPAEAGSFKDPLETPAMNSTIATTSMLTAVTRTPGGRIVAVGRRGHILLSDDGGKTWKQAPAPVSTDLVAVQFVDAQQGWAVGQGGVVLHSSNGGTTWSKQMDGRQAAALLVKHFEALAGDERFARALEDAKRFQDEGPGRPFLDVWFESPLRGFIVGAYNMIFHTEDGGTTWAPWSDRVPNDNGLHLNAIRAIGDELYIVGEQGSLWCLDRQRQQFATIATPYAGTYFGLIGKPGALILFGLRGHAFRSEDGGKNWKPIETGANGGLAAGTVIGGDRLVLVSLGGEILTGALTDDRLQAIKAERPMPYYGVTASDAGLVLVGALGTRLQHLP